MIEHFDMSSRSKPETNFFLLAVLIVCLWTVLIATVVAVQAFGYEKSARTHAHSDALSAFTKDVLFRQWASAHGGVYVPETATMKPNPYLKVPHRDVSTTDGVKLTLVNPAYMTRLVHQLGEEQGEIKGHITSLKPTNPVNEPDDWEAESLRAFEKGTSETSVVRKDGETEIYRFMRPFVTEASCLKCHADQGYKVGEIRGGVSISLPFAPFRAEAKADNYFLIWAFAAIWLVGLSLILTAALRIGKDLNARFQTERLLQEMNARLALSVEQTSSDLATARANLETKGESERSLVARLAETQARLIDNEKTAALGLLVSSIAHDLNTPLGSISSSAASIDEIAGRILAEWDEGGLVMTREERELVVAFIKSCRDALSSVGFADTSGAFERLKGFLAAHNLSLSAEMMEELAEFPLGFELEPFLPLFASRRADRLLTAAIFIVALIRCNKLISIATEKAARDIAALEQFSSEGSSLNPKSCSARDILEASVGLFSAEDLRVVAVVRDYGTEGRVVCDSEALSRVFFNLIKNALQAMQYEGTLWLSISESGADVVIEVANDGPVIPDSVRAKLFSPFYTTKKRGEASGLGLFLAKQIIERSGGAIEFTSALGKTVFSVRLPAGPLP